MKRCVRRILTAGMSFAVAGVMLTSAALRHPARTFNVSSSVNDSDARIVGYDEATGRRVVLSVWTDARACCSEADFAGAAGAASPVV